MYCVPVNNKQNVALPNKRVIVKPTRKRISDIQRRTACGPAQQTRHGETYTKNDFRHFDDGQHVALPTRRVIVKPIRKLISDPSTSSSMWPGQQTRHGETYTKIDFRPVNSGQHVALPNKRVMVKPIRKLISDPSTTGSMWPCPTDASW